MSWLVNQDCFDYLFKGNVNRERNKREEMAELHCLFFKYAMSRVYNWKLLNKTRFIYLVLSSELHLELSNQMLSKSKIYTGHMCSQLAPVLQLRNCPFYNQLEIALFVILECLQHMEYSNCFRSKGLGGS